MALKKPNDDARGGKLYQEVCALLVAAEERIRFACNSVPMPPARYMLSFNTREDRCWTWVLAWTRSGHQV